MEHLDARRADADLGIHKAYGLPNFDGNLRKRDLVADTPYNTYTRAGLPPTPIAMPGLADETFAKSVVYLCEHTEKGALGLVINKPIDTATFAFAMGACVLVLARHGGVRPVWVPAILTIALAATLAWWPWHGRKAFFRDVTELEPGAPRADVRARMDRWHRKHPFEDHAPFLANLDPRRDLWSRGAGSFDQVVVSYDESDRVVKIERLVD